MLADIIFILHFSFVLFVVGGGFLAVRWPKWAWVHAPAALWGMMIEFTGGTCPLTFLENEFRLRVGRGAYEEGFIEHYLVPILYPATLTRETQIFLGFAVLAINAVAYGWLIRKWMRMRLVNQSNPAD